MLLRFAVISDPHIALPKTIGDARNRFHLVEVSVPALEIVLERLQQLNLDFLLLPGDLTQDGEPENHYWLQERLKSLPFPAYVVPGNHDVPTLLPSEISIGIDDFPYFYKHCGYGDSNKLYYTKEILPGVQLIALNSNQFDDRGYRIGCLDTEQLVWLEATLKDVGDKLVLVMVHHNVIEHLPGQASHELGKRYILSNANALLEILQRFGVKLIFTGHLHVQDIARAGGIYEITTGSLVSYPHPYRIVTLATDDEGNNTLKIESYRVEKLSGWENLADISREWIGERSSYFMFRLLTTPPLNLPRSQAERLVPHLRYFWADIAAGDALLDFPDFPPKVREYFRQFGATSSIDNHAILTI